MNRIQLSIAVAVALAPMSASAGPLEDCWQDKLEAVADFADASGACSLAAARFENFQACRDAAVNDLENSWLAIEGGAGDAACDDGATADDIQDFSEWLFYDITQSIGLGLPPATVIRELSGKLSAAVGDYAARLLDAEATHVQTPDPGALAAAQKKASKKFSKQWKKAAKRAKKRGFVFKTKPGPTADLVRGQSQHLATVATLGEPDPPPAGAIADTNDGILVEAARTGEDISIVWEPSKKTAKKAAWFELQEWNGYRWHTAQLVSSSPSAWFAFETEGFCMRIMAFKKSNKPFASGMSGDSGPCI